MSASLRMLRIEARRNVALLFFPVVLGIAWMIARSNRYMMTFLWSDASAAVQDSLALAGPVLGGAAAWMAGRDRRRGMQELLASTARPEAARRLSVWAATALWGVLAYALFAAYRLGGVYFQATWGDPDGWPLLVTLLAIIAQVAIGYAAGVYLASRFTAPLVAISLFAAMFLLPDMGAAWISYLSPTAKVWDPLYIEKLYETGPGQSLYWLGLTGLALSAVVLRSNRRPVTWAVLTASMSLVIGGATLLYSEVPRFAGQYAYEETAAQVNEFGEYIPKDAKVVPFEPACSDAPVSICAHPAYKPVLETTSAAVNKLAAPLAGVPGAPARLNMPEYVLRDAATYGHIGWQRGMIATSLITGVTMYHGESPTNEAQLAILNWLVQRDGGQTECEGPLGEESGSPWERACAATERFAGLTAAQQRAWLERNYADLRAGKLTLEDLP